MLKILLVAVLVKRGGCVLDSIRRAAQTGRVRFLGFAAFPGTALRVPVIHAEPLALGRA